MYDGHANLYALKFKGHNLSLGPLLTPKPLKFKLGKGSEKILYIRETRVERTISKSKPLFALLLVESNTSEEVKPPYILLLNHC